MAYVGSMQGADHVSPSSDRTPRPGDYAAMQQGANDAFGQNVDLTAVLRGGPQMRMAGLDGQNEAPGQAPQQAHGHQHAPEQDSEAAHVAGIMLTSMLPGAAAVGAKVMHAQEFYEKEMKSEGSHAHQGRRADGAMTVNNDEVVDMGKVAREHAAQARMRGPMGRM